MSQHPNPNPKHPNPKHTLVGLAAVVAALVVLVLAIVGAVEGATGEAQTLASNPPVPATHTPYVPAPTRQPKQATTDEATPITYRALKTFSGAGSTATPDFLAPAGGRVVWSVTATAPGGSALFDVHTAYSDGTNTLPGPAFSASTFPAHGATSLKIRNPLGELVRFKVFASGVSWRLAIEQPAP